MMAIVRSRIVPLFCLLLLLGGCAPTRTETVWKAENYERPLGKLLVIGVIHQELRRGMLENMFVRKFKAAQVEAVAGQQLFPQLDESLTRETVLARARADGVAHILVSRPVSRKDLVNYQPGRPSYKWAYAQGEDFAFYGWGYTPSVDRYDSQEGIVATHLFQVESGRMVWKSLSDVWVRETPETVIDPYTDLVLRQLRASQLIR